jgi:hypothetical protein
MAVAGGDETTNGGSGAMVAVGVAGEMGAGGVTAGGTVARAVACGPVSMADGVPGGVAAGGALLPTGSGVAVGVARSGDETRCAQVRSALGDGPTLAKGVFSGVGTIVGDIAVNWLASAVGVIGGT